MVQGDPDLLGQVIQNLTSNAVKYNIEKGLVRFLLKVRGDNVYFTISNTGNPIPFKDRERIFDRFYRVINRAAGRCRGPASASALPGKSRTLTMESSVSSPVRTAWSPLPCPYPATPANFALHK